MRYSRKNRILTERGLWDNSLKKKTASELLSEQTDFKMEREWLAQILGHAECQILWFPKFHCELNPIELVWGFIKAYFRKNCSFSYKDLLQKIEPFMNTKYFAAYYGHCQRFMDGYKHGLTGNLLDFPVKKYRSHRTFPEHAIIKKDYQEKFEKK
jgi:transposase